MTIIEKADGVLFGGNDLKGGRRSDVMHVTGSRRERKLLCMCMCMVGEIRDEDTGEYRQSIIHCVYENRQQNPLLGG